MKIIEIPATAIRIGDHVARASKASNAVEITLSNGTTDRVTFHKVAKIDRQAPMLYITDRNGEGIVSMTSFTEYVKR